MVLPPLFNMEAIIIIVAIVLAIAAFFTGRHFASKPIDNENEKIKQEEKQLKEKIQQQRTILSELEYKILAGNNNLQTIQQRYEDSKKTIEDTKALAQEAYDTNMQVYARKMADEQKHFEETVEQYKNQIVQVKEELDSYKATKAAAIEAARKEQTVKDNKKEYSLLLSGADEGDIIILQEVQRKISKPRTIAMAIWSGYYQPVAKAKFPKILGKQDVCGVYKITNWRTGECYIGQSVDVRKRWYEHTKAGLGIDTPANNKLYAAMQEFGLDDFTFELLEECAADELDAKEKYFIELYQANITGYNSTGGNN